MKITKAQTNLQEIELSKIIEADWNYKSDGTDEEIDKLIKSIEKDKSAGVFAVREITKNRKKLFEVMDGNHRLRAIKKMGWKTALCENFGAVRDSDAVLIAKRRNHNWFPDDIFKLQQQFNQKVFKDYNLDELTQFMPDSKNYLESLKEIGDLPWERSGEGGFKGESTGGDSEGSDFVEFKLKIPKETFKIWNDWKDRCEDFIGAPIDDYRALEFALIEATNMPDESLEERLQDD